MKRKVMLNQSKPTRVPSQKVEITRRVVKQLRRRLRTDLLAVGAVGSVARGSAERYSDVDLVVIVKRIRRELPNQQIIVDAYCSINQQTFKGVVSQLSQPYDELPETSEAMAKFYQSTTR